MGGICCSGAREIQPASNVEKTKHPFPKVTEKPKDTIKKCGNWLFDIIGLENTNRFLAEDLEELSDLSYKADNAKLIDQKLDFFQINYRFWINLKDSDDQKTKIHYYTHQVEWPFTPAYHFLFELQEKLTGFSKTDDSVEEFEILNIEKFKNTIIVVSRMKTKKVLTVNPKQFLLVRIIRRVGKNSFKSCTRSVQLTELVNLDKFKELIEAEKENAIIYNAGTSFVDDDGRFVLSMFSKVDLQSSIGLGMIKPALKKKFPNIYNEQSIKMLKFLLKNHDLSQFVWFSDDQKELREIINQNVENVKKWKLDLNKIGLENLDIEKPILIKEGSNQAVYEEENVTEDLNAKCNSEIALNSNASKNNDTNKKCQSVNREEFCNESDIGDLEIQIKKPLESESTHAPEKNDISIGLDNSTHSNIASDQHDQAHKKKKKKKKKHHHGAEPHLDDQ